MGPRSACGCGCLGQDDWAGWFWADWARSGAACGGLSDEGDLLRCGPRASRRGERFSCGGSRLERAAPRGRLCERARAPAARDWRAVQCEDVRANETDGVFDQYLARTC